MGRFGILVKKKVLWRLKIDGVGRLVEVQG